MTDDCGDTFAVSPRPPPANRLPPRAAAAAAAAAAKCTLYCFLTGMVGGAASGWLRMFRIWRQSVFCIVFYKGWWGGVVMGSGWPPVAWGRGCLLIGNSDKPLPEGEEGAEEEERRISLDHLRPEGWWD